MRQLTNLMGVIRKAEKVEFYNKILSYRAFQGERLPSLDEFLGLTSNDSGEDPKAFDEKTDKLLEQEALKNLELKKAAAVNG